MYALYISVFYPFFTQLVNVAVQGHWGMNAIQFPANVNAKRTEQDATVNNVHQD